MKRIAQIISWSALAATLALPSIFYAGGMELSSMQRGMFALAVVWFVATPLWMEHKVEG